MRSVRFRLQLAVVATALAGGGLVALATPASAAPATPAGSDATEAVIVVLADQLDATPPDATHLPQRGQRAHSTQQAVLSHVSGRKPTDIKQFVLGNAFSATVTAAQARALAADPAVASVTVGPVGRGDALDGQAHYCREGRRARRRLGRGQPGRLLDEPGEAGTGARGAAARSTPAPTTPTPRPLPRSASTAPASRSAFIADGIDPSQAGFIRKNGTSSIVDYKDFYGDGPNAPTSGAEAFGDASTISAQGNVVYDVADFANPAVVNYTGGHCYIKIVGVAPGADVVALKAGSELLPNSSILQAIDYAVTVDHVDVINESFGANIYPDSSARATRIADVRRQRGRGRRHGDGVEPATPAPPARSAARRTDPNVISAGATTDSRLYEQTGYALATAFGNGTWLDNNISALSSAGITQNGRTIDLSAPGEADWALCDDNGNFSGCRTMRAPATATSRRSAAPARRRR